MLEKNYKKDVGDLQEIEKNKKSAYNQFITMQVDHKKKQNALRQRENEDYSRIVTSEYNKINNMEDKESKNPINQHAFHPLRKFNIT